MVPDTIAEMPWDDPPARGPGPGPAADRDGHAILGADAHALIGAIGVGVMIYGPDGRILDANPRAEALIGFRLGAIRGRLPQPSVPLSIGPHGEPIAHEDLPVRRAIRQRRPVLEEVMGLRRADGTVAWLLVSAWPVHVAGELAGAVATITDHTARFEVERAERTVTSATHVLVRATDEDALLQDMCDAIVAAGGYAVAWVGRAEDDEAGTVSMIAGAGAVDYLEPVRVSWREGHELSDGPTGTSLRTATVQVCDDVRSDLALGPWRDRFAAFGFSSCLAIPFELGRGGRGVLTIHSRDIHAFEPRSRALLVDLARDLEYGLRHLQTTQDLAASEARFRLLAENTGDVVVLSRNSVIEWVSPSARSALGWDPADMVGRRFDWFAHPDEQDDVRRARADTRAGIRATYRGRMRRPDGTWAWVDARTRPVLGTAGHPDGSVITTLWDTSAEVAAQEALAHAATHDALTGLANRSLLLSELDRALAASRRSGLPTAVLLLDLDHFKYVNDSLGHAVGDDLLCAAARRMLATVRAEDLVARPGGDEFVVVMRALSDPSEAVAVATRLTLAFREPIVVGDAELFTTASIGVAVSSGRDQDALDLLREADTAMYRAKGDGRDRTSTFNEDLRDSVTRRLNMVNELRTALERHELAVWFQPEVALVDGRILAVEALLRWHHPDGELYPAGHFIETAEETGLILDIGRWVLRETCTLAARWVETRPEHPLVVRVNLSPLQLAESRLLGDLDDALGASGIDPRRLCLEITETAMLHETATVRSNMAGIHRRGIGVAIDDFGTGYASLTYLRRYPVDTVKLDRSFVTNLGVLAQDEHIVAGIIDLARRLGIAVIAEGVETTAQAEHLRHLGCPAAQGHLFSAAVPPERVAALLASGERLGPDR